MANWRKVSEWLAAIGATNWGVKTLFDFDVVQYLSTFAGASAGTVAMVTYLAIGVSGAYLIYELAEGR